jgi:hypothetical protein
MGTNDFFRRLVLGPLSLVIGGLTHREAARSPRCLKSKNQDYSGLRLSCARDSL